MQRSMDGQSSGISTNDWTFANFLRCSSFFPFFATFNSPWSTSHWSSRRRWQGDRILPQQLLRCLPVRTFHSGLVSRVRSNPFAPLEQQTWPWEPHISSRSQQGLPRILRQRWKRSKILIPSTLLLKPNDETLCLVSLRLSMDSSAPSISFSSSRRKDRA